jgi:predicted nucleic acid-binding protein
MSADAEMILKAVDGQVIHKLSYREFLISLAAEKSGSGILWSEDSADGALIRHVRIINPFKERKKSDDE